MRALLHSWRPLARYARLAHFDAVNAGREIVAQGPNELLLYYTNVFLPVRVYDARVRRFVERQGYAGVADAVARSFPADLDVSVLMTVPRPAEGAAFVKISCPDRARATDVAAAGFARRWLFFSHRVTGYEVRGRPSLTHTPPPTSAVLQVSPALDETTLDELMNGYGRIRDVTANSVTFFHPQAAVTARNCLNRLPFRGQELSIVLVRSRGALARATSWFSSHPRFSVPLLLFVLIGAISSVFDPVREYCISAKVRGTTTISWLKKQAKYYLGLVTNSSLLAYAGKRSDDGDELEDREGKLSRLAKSAAQLKTYLGESEPTFVVVFGPHGSGKSRIVDYEVSRVSDLVLNIDCSRLTDSQGDDRKLSMLSRMLGYWPAFPWANRIARLIDLEVKAMTGQPGGISETTEQQSSGMLEKTRRALQRLALRHKTDPKQSDEDYLEANAADRPVVVIRGYASGEKLPNTIVEWASGLIVSNIARVVLVTRDASFDRTLASVLPNHPPKVVSVEDASALEARDFVLSRLNSRLATSPEAKAAFAAFAQLDPEFIMPLGGRFTDLQAYARRLSNGEMPDVALRNQVAQAALSVALQYLRAENVPWTPEQAWTLINMLHAAPDATGGWISVPGSVALMPAFKGANVQGVLEALEAQEMISVRSQAGRIVGIKASRPLIAAAFGTLVNDGITATDMNIKVYEQQIKNETAQIGKLETELGLLSQAPPKASEVAYRQSYLCAKLRASQDSIYNLERLVKAQRQQLIDMGTKDLSAEQDTRY